MTEGEESGRAMRTKRGRAEGPGEGWHWSDGLDREDAGAGLPGGKDGVTLHMKHCDPDVIGRTSPGPRRSDGLCLKHVQVQALLPWKVSEFLRLYFGHLCVHPPQFIESGSGPHTAIQIASHPASSRNSSILPTAPLLLLALPSPSLS